MSLDLDPIKARISDCATYNFGMHNADTLAKQDAPALVAEVERLRHQLSHVEVDRDHYKNQSAEVERLQAVISAVVEFCSDFCTEGCCEACRGQNEAYQQVLDIIRESEKA